MSSPTQRQLTAEEIGAIAREAFGRSTEVLHCGQLSGGGFAAVWRVDLRGHPAMVLKVGPPPEIPLLTYERGMIAAEAAYLRLVAGLGPFPEVVSSNDDWIFMTHRPGSSGSLSPSVRAQLGAVMAKVHQIKGTFFGYAGERPQATNWPAAFSAMMEAMLADAVAWNVPLPVPPDHIRSLVAAGRDALSEVEQPSLVHFDLWDGNVLAVGDQLTGLVDGERYLYGDPLFDFVSPNFGGRIEDFAAGYGPIVLDESAQWRLDLYRLYFFLLMVVEVPSRGMSAEQLAQRCEWLVEQAGRRGTTVPTSWS